MYVKLNNILVFQNVHDNSHAYHLNISNAFTYFFALRLMETFLSRSPSQSLPHFLSLPRARSSSSTYIYVYINFLLIHICIYIYVHGSIGILPITLFVSRIIQFCVVVFIICVWMANDFSDDPKSFIYLWQNLKRLVQ